MIAKYPHDLFYDFYAVLIVGLLLSRLVHYYTVGYHYYLFDYCYYANFVVIYFVTLGKDSDLMFKIAFLYANGIIARSVYLFRNSMVLHRLD